jgi:radical SAM superfamily enzyme YgiQ (UPF0313 family)
MGSQKKIVLVSANQVVDPYPVYPLGLSYLSSYLKKKLPEFEIVFFDMNTSTIDNFAAMLRDVSPSYIGISLRNIDDVQIRESHGIIEGYQALVNVVRRNSASRLILGGAGFSIFPVVLFELLKPDFGISGEGEESFYDLIVCLENNLPYHDVGGLVYAGEHKTILQPRKGFIHNLELSFEDSIVDYYWRQGGMLNIQTKRGCPHRCIYCTYPLIEGKNVRTLDPDEIVRSVSDLKSRYGIDYVFFTDSVFNIVNEYNIVLAKKMIESKVDINWGAYFSPYGLTEDTLRLYKESGLSHIEFGTESISEAQLKNYGKHFTVKDVFETSELCNKTDIHFAHFLILGGYGETEQTLDETFQNSRLIENTVYFPYIGMRIYPGTRLAELAVEEGVLDSRDGLLSPRYYISKNINANTIPKRAEQTGKKWIFPNDDIQRIVDTMRLKQWKGPLWEHAKY